MMNTADAALSSNKVDACSQEADEGTGLLPPTEEIESVLISKEAVTKEFLALWKLVFPNWIAGFLDFSIGSVTTVTAGALGTKELNAASLGQITVASLCIAPLVFGLSAALDTLATQAYTSSNPKNTALYVQRTGVLILLGFIPSFAILFKAEAIFLSIGQDPCVANLAGQYIRVSLLYMPFLAVSELTRKWLQAQGLVKVRSVVLIVAAPLSVGLNVLLVHGPDSVRLGFIGAPIAVAATNILICFLLVIYCYFFVARNAWCAVSRATFLDLGPNMKLGIAGTLSVSSEWLAIDLCALASSYLGSTQFAANQIGGLIATFTYQMPFALGMAASVRVGNRIGAGDKLVNSGIVLLFGRAIVRFVTRDSEVLSYMDKMLLPIALFQIGDDIAGASYGILRGAGLASSVAKANVIAYWTFVVPLGLLLAFHLHFGVTGIWIGHVCTLGLLSVLLSYRVFRVNWLRQCEKAKEQSAVTETFLSNLQRDGCQDP